MQEWLGQKEIAQHAGLVIPAYFSANTTNEMVRRLLTMTLQDCDSYFRWQNVRVVVDGDPRTAGILQDMRARLLERQGTAFHVMPLPENRGKFWAIRTGIGALLEADDQLDYVVIRDSDGDHIIDDTPALVRTAAFLRQTHGHLKIIVAGTRSSRIHPMGWIRGELEAVLDRIKLDALAYHLARQGRALRQSYLRHDAVPDLSSGYKVYGREIAEMLFVDHKPQFVSLSPSDYWHYGPETVTLVEAVLAGALVAESPRLTWDGQPTSSFGEFRHIALYGELLAWVFCRLELPLTVAAALYDNVLPASSLRTTEEGRELLASLRDHALQRMRTYRGIEAPIPPPTPTLPFL